jgi:hypothetical protein
MSVVEDKAARILNEEIEHEAWFIELLSKEWGRKVLPSGHFRSGDPASRPTAKTVQKKPSNDGITTDCPLRRRLPNDDRN